MVTRYPTIYRDKYGEERIVIESTGTSLRTMIRGVEFTGKMFDDFMPVIAEIAKLQPFTFDMGYLTEFNLVSEIPILVVVDGVPQQVTLQFNFELGLRKEEIVLELTYDNHLFKATDVQGFIDTVLYDISKQLPKNTYLKICWFCAFSEFNPAGFGAFGGLACFRDNKDGIRKAKTKIELFRVWDTLTEYVQETHLCPEFEKRQV
ncbi:MAG: DUF6304 family protein [Anaerolineae bacterium]